MSKELEKKRFKEIKKYLVDELGMYSEEEYEYDLSDSPYGMLFYYTKDDVTFEVYFSYGTGYACDFGMRVNKTSRSDLSEMIPCINRVKWCEKAINKVVEIDKKYGIEAK